MLNLTRLLQVPRVDTTFDISLHTDRLAFAWNKTEDLQHWNIENMGDPKENYERWYNASPYFFLDRINAPVQLICGGNDPRCPARDSMEARDKLEELGKEVEFLLCEEEGNSFLKTENVIDSEVRRVEFFQRCWKDDGRSRLKRDLQYKRSIHGETKVFI